MSWFLIQFPFRHITLFLVQLLEALGLMTVRMDHPENNQAFACGWYSNVIFLWDTLRIMRHPSPPGRFIYSPTVMEMSQLYNRQNWIPTYFYFIFLHEQESKVTNEGSYPKSRIYKANILISTWVIFFLFCSIYFY